jgi:hypothetical protein
MLKLRAIAVFPHIQKVKVIEQEVPGMAAPDAVDEVHDVLRRTTCTTSQTTEQIQKRRSI